MKILILTPQLPYPPMQGTTLRNFYLLRELAKRHDISLLTFAQPDDDLSGDSPLRAFCRSIKTIPAPPSRRVMQRAFTSLASPLPDMALRLPSRQMLCAAREWTARERFDVLQIEGIEMATYGLAVMHSRVRTRMIFDDHNAEYVLQRSAFQSDMRQPTRWHSALYSFVQWQKLLRYERRVIRAHDATAAVSDVDARALNQIVPTQKIFVVPNGVDTKEYAPSDGASVKLSSRHSCDLVFTGKMDYRPNIDAALWFADEILPRVREQLPDARFVIVGQSLHARLQSLARRDAVMLTGRVDDVKPYIARACVYVAPLRMGGGTRLKVLQAMAMAKPIVSTTLGCDGIAVQHGREVLLADTSTAFADAVIRLARDASLQHELGANARALAVTRYDWSLIAPLMEALY